MAAVVPPASAALRVPGSKSFTNRAAVLAGLCPAGVELEGVLFSDDSWWAFDSLARLGFCITLNMAAETVHVEPPQVPTPLALASLGAQPERLYFGMAGTLARFFPAVVLNYARTFPHVSALMASSIGDGTSAQGGGLSVIATGASRLCERPLSELILALRALGAKISSDKLPITFPNILGARALEGKCAISGKTSGQFLSGLLMAAAGSRNSIEIERVDTLVQPDYVRMTVGALAAFGAEVHHDPSLTLFRVHCPEGLASTRYVIEADASTACYFLAFAALFNIDLILTNIGSSSLQPDLQFTSFLERLGVAVDVHEGSVRVHPRAHAAHAAAATELIGSGNTAAAFVPFRGGFEVDFHACSDQALTAGVLALFADAPIRVFGVEHIRAHESDRIASLVKNLVRLGVACTEEQGGFTVVPPAPGTVLQGEWETHHDHRFGMTGFLVASRHWGVEILDPGCVEKTAPDFFVRMEKLGVRFF